ncbi:hypothetical protein GCK72_016146 [Caenorhabditis remanei]|uniref:Uncharacterized protein n=1 Tax=Caenorhabditis remanei TaxID=31234 RepID=A0A6A5GYD4_CAERE|nr:hypothetical protein GCK72_016146 [Caenorhabditis remanei]KAF1759679.1 hypothetical protein GCK72_016146 [Caenorhabditis remanei]
MNQRRSFLQEELSEIKLLDDIGHEEGCTLSSLFGNVEHFFVGHLNRSITIQVSDVSDERESEHLDSTLSSNCDLVAGAHSEGIGTNSFEERHLERIVGLVTEGYLKGSQVWNHFRLLPGIKDNLIT